MSTRPSPLPSGSGSGSGHAAEPGPAGPAPAPNELAFVALLDIVLVVMAVPVALLLGAPVLGILAGAGIWIVQRLVELGVARVAKGKTNIKAAIGYNLGAMVGRAWLVGLTILIVGTAGERKDGLAAAVLVFCAFTAYFATALLARSFERNVTPS